VQQFTDGRYKKSTIMQVKFFQIPSGGSEGMEAEINAFLRSHRILKVERELVQRETSPCWAVCVEYMDGSVVSGSSGRSGSRGGDKKVDYKEILSEADFSVFLLLRDLRKSLAEIEGVPMYAIFTNEQLAKLAQARVQSQADLEKIEGVGNAKIEKYGRRVLDTIAAASVLRP
jgi:superfamily II DNA helicase RecQ